MIYLSRIRLNLRDKKSRLLIKDCYELHRNISSAFSDENGSLRSKHNILYYLNEKAQVAELYVQSDIPPLWGKSVFQSDDNTHIEIKDISHLEKALNNGMLFAFRLFACPSKKIDNNGRNSKRIFLYKREDQINWLIRKGEQYGFEIINPQSVCIKSNEAVFSRKKGIFFRGAEYLGYIRVTNKEKFIEGLKKGIGSEKAFGCGLIMLFPPRRIA